MRSFGVHPAVRERMEAQVRLEVYAEHLKKWLARDEKDEAAKAKLGELRKRLNVEDAAADELEKVVRRQLALERPAGATPP